MSCELQLGRLVVTLRKQLSAALRTLSVMESQSNFALEAKESNLLLLHKAIFAVYINGKGRVAHEHEVQSLNPKQYALYLNLTSGILVHHLPGGEFQIITLQEAGIEGVQDILGVMLQYPHLNFGNVNIGLFLPHRAEMTPDAFRKAMAKIRYAIQGGSKDGPLLLHFDRSHFTISDSGHAWRISIDAGDLCFIKFLSLPKRFRRQRRP